MKQRQMWGTRTGFILAAVGSAAGLGNVWRFPYVTYDNGGGAFLLPYLIALLTAGIPLMIFEFTMGHKYRGSGPLAFSRMSGGWQWLGWWQVIISFVISTYYAVILAWAILYTGFSFGLSWGENTGAFFMGTFLGAPDDPLAIGGIQPLIFGFLVVTWFLSFIIMYQGVHKGIERASRIFMPILAIMVFLIMIRGVTLPGAFNGLNHLLTPQWSALSDAQVWVAAYSQVFYSLSICFAIMVTYAGYLPKKSDINNNAFITAFANCGFSFVAAIGIFGAIGYMSEISGQPVAGEGGVVTGGGAGLAFVVIPQILNEFPAMNSFFGVLFFLTLSLAGLTSFISVVNVVIQAVADKFAISYRKSVVWVHIVCGLVSMIYATGNGVNILTIVDHFILSHGVAISGLIEAMMFAWFLRKIQVFRAYSNPLSDFNINRVYLILTMGILTPIILGYMTIRNIIIDIVTPYDGYPQELLLTLGWGLLAVSLILSFALHSHKWVDRLSAVQKEEKTL